MDLHVIETGNFKLDGGAMFGSVPKAIWNHLYPADEHNLINLAMRCLLVEDGDKLILLDNGIGDKQSEKFFSFYYLNGDFSLKQSLRQAGFDFSDITDVVLSHLHFDHCGGSVKHNADRSGWEPAFPNATFWVTREQWEWACNPNPKEKPSFLKENIMPLQESGQLSFLTKDTVIHPGLSFRIMNGHTDGQIITLVRYNNNTLAYCADLIPTAAHIPLIYVMGYDTRPLITVGEKAAFLDEAFHNDYKLFFEHDINTHCSSILHTEKGFRKGDTFSLQELV